jgi:hypothetical protein
MIWKDRKTQPFHCSNWERESNPSINITGLCAMISYPKVWCSRSLQNVDTRLQTTRRYAPKKNCNIDTNMSNKIYNLFSVRHDTFRFYTILRFINVFTKACQLDPHSSAHMCTLYFSKNFSSMPPSVRLCFYIHTLRWAPNIFNTFIN